VRAIKPAIDDLKDGDLITLAGWGKKEDGQLSGDLLFGESKIYSTEKCKSQSDFHAFVNGKISFCIWNGAGDGESAECRGDSGGPAFTGAYGFAVQYGIVSYGGEKCGKSPGVFTRVSFFHDWILQKTKHQVCTACVGCSSTTIDSYKGLCSSIEGTFSNSGTKLCCGNLNFEKTSLVDYTWNDCSNKEMRKACKQVGRFRCFDNVAKCIRL